MATTGPQAAHRHARGGRDRVLLGDADVDQPAGEALAERQQSGRVGHGRGDGDELGMLLARLDQRLGEGGGVRAGLRLAAHVVQALDRIVLRRRVAAALLGHHVHDDRAVVLRGITQRALEAAHVVAVERAGVAHAEVLEEGARLEVLAHRGDRGLQASFHAVADERHLVQRPVEPGALAQVRRAHPQAGDALAELRDRGRVRAAVVVEDDDRLAAGVAEVVQALERHAAGHRPVADHGDDAPVAVLVGVGLDRGGEPVRVADDRRGVAVLDPVVLRLGPVRIAGQARRPGASVGEVLAPAGDDLVDVGLVARVPQDDVARRVEHPVHGQRQLDRAEVGPEVAAVSG